MLRNPTSKTPLQNKSRNEENLTYNFHVYKENTYKYYEQTRQIEKGLLHENFLWLI